MPRAVPPQVEPGPISGRHAVPHHVALLVFALCACGPKPTPVPDAGPLQAGVATVALDAPVGVSMGGYSARSRLKGMHDPGSPFAANFAASQGVQTLPTARALALSNGVSRVVIVRVDTALIPASLRYRAQATLREAGSDAQLIVEGTHSHSGPARTLRPAPVEGGTFDPATTGMDVFDPEVEDRLGVSIGTAAKQALEALRPVAMGTTRLDLTAFNHDRRCENDMLYGPNFKDPMLTLVRFDEVDATGTPTKPYAGFIHYAMHGTIANDDNPLFSVDAPGLMEVVASDVVGVPLVYLQGTAGDVSPESGSINHPQFQSMERLARTAAPLIARAFEQAAPTTAPARATLLAYEDTFEISRTNIGYAAGEFPNNGAIGCGLGGDNCNPTVETTIKNLLCLPLKRNPYMYSAVTVVRLGDVVFVSLPGEPTTAIGKRLEEAIDAGTVLTIGYAQDHGGYLLEERDYLSLGYEPSVSPFGPKYGAFLVSRAASAFSKLGQTPPPAPEPERLTFTPRPALNSTIAPAVEGTVADVERLNVATFTFNGGDPALGTPEVWLEKQEGAAFVPAQASPVRRVGLGLELLLRSVQSPTYLAEPNATARSFKWVTSFEVLADFPAGHYRFVARGKAKVGGAVSSYELNSNPFEVKTSGAAATNATAKFLSDGRLAVQFLFPPNPEVSEFGLVTAGYRLRDAFTDPNVGSVVSGGSATATLVAPGMAPRDVPLTWDEAARAHVAMSPRVSGQWQVKLGAGALVDAFGNRNAAARMFTLTVP